MVVGKTDEGRQRSQADRDWQDVLKLAWRPAWQIRSRRGTFPLLSAWLKHWFRSAFGSKPMHRP